MKRYFITRETKYQHFKKVKLIDWNQSTRVAFLSWLRSKKSVAFDIETTSIDPFLGKIVLYSFCDGQAVFIFDGLTIPIESIPDGKNLWQNTTMIAHNAAFELKWLEPLHIGHLIPETVFCTLVAEGKLLQGAGESLSLLNTLNRRGISLPSGMDKDVRKEFGSNYTKHEEYHVIYNAGDTEILHELMAKQQVVINKLNLNYLIYHIHMPLCKILASIENTGWKLNVSEWLSLAQKAENAMHDISFIMNTYLKAQNIDIATLNPESFSVRDKLKNRISRDRSSLQKVLLNIQLKQKQYQGKLDKLSNLKVWKILTERRTKLTINITNNESKLSNLYSAPAYLNWSSSKQVIAAWQALGLNPMPMSKSISTRKFQPSIGVAAREKWLLENKSNTHFDLIANLDAYQKLSKQVSSFGREFITKYEHPKTKRFHTSYKQATVATGRLASGDVKAGRFNSQQIPRDNNLRNCFLADDENYLIATADLSGAELVTMAALANDKHLLKLSQGDMHSYFANLGWKAIYDSRGDIWSEYSRISKDQNNDKRTDYKPMTFGTIYGLRGKKAAETLNVSEQEGQIAINTITDEIPDTINMVVEASNFASAHGYVVHNTRTNSRRWFPETLKKVQGKPYDQFMTMTEESAARNTRIQGTQADMLAEAMVLLDRYIKRYNLDIKMKMQVHDEIVVQFHKDYHDWFPNRLTDIMTRSANKYLNNVATMQADVSVEPFWTK